MIEVAYATNKYGTETVQIPENGSDVYLNTIGLMSVEGGFKNGHLDEVVLTIKDDTHIVVKETLKATGDAKAVNSDAYIVGIYGVN